MPSETPQQESAKTHTLTEIPVEVKIPMPEVYISLSIPTDFFKPDVRIAEPSKR